MAPQATPWWHWRNVGKGFYSCRVADDELGAFYREDLVANGVATNLTHTKPPEGQTGICMVMVTPDAERSMSTFLGATAELDALSLHAKDIARSKIYYMEGYLAHRPRDSMPRCKGVPSPRKRVWRWPSRSATWA